MAGVASLGPPCIAGAAGPNPMPSRAQLERKDNRKNAQTGRDAAKSVLLVLGEIQHSGVIENLRGRRSERVHGESLPALRTQIEPQLLIDVLADLTAVRLLQMFKEILDFFEMISVVLLIADDRIESGGDFNFDDVMQVFLGIQLSFAQIARVMNHGPAPE
jgi:hypothetical protein